MNHFNVPSVLKSRYAQSVEQNTANSGVGVKWFVSGAHVRMRHLEIRLKGE